MEESAKPKTIHGGRVADALAVTVEGEHQATPLATEEPPHRIGRFVILRQLGRGGMGVVFAAYDEELDRKVALKLLHGAELASADRRARILREAQAMARVSHPNVVHIYEVGEVGEQVFIAMEFVEGSTLTTWQSQLGRTWEELLSMYLAAGHGLLAAHKAGLVHRDFKPDNVLVGSDERPRVADFGLARAEGTCESQEQLSPLSPTQRLITPLTAAGALVGTPAYMSPEQYRGEPTDGRSDQFSFCAALYEALYRQLPFSGQDLADLSGNVLLGKIQSVPKQSGVPPVMEQVLRRGLSVDPAQRFPSMAELLTALVLDPQHDPGGAPRTQRIVTGVLIGVVALILVGIQLQDRQQVVTLRQMLAVSSFMLLGALIVCFFLRRELLRNSFHRGMAKMLISVAAQMVALRLVALLGGLSVAQTIAIDLMAMASFGLLISWNYLPRAWPVPVLNFAVGVIVARFPHLALPLGNVFLPGSGILIFLAWRRAIRRHAVAATRTTQGPNRAPQGSF